MRNSISIQSYIPNQQIHIAQEINTLHKKTLDLYQFDVPSNNCDWINKKNIIGFFARDLETKEILCAYRHEFIFNEAGIVNTPFLQGITIDSHKNLKQRLCDLANEGPYSETCAFWCPPNMPYKKSGLSRYLFTYGIMASFFNGSANVLGLAPLNLVNYYTSYGLTTDKYHSEVINYSNQLHPSQFVLYDKKNNNKKMYDEILQHMENKMPIKLEPYKNTLLYIQEPILLFGRNKKNFFLSSDFTHKQTHLKL